jgi:hypothetical protein
MMQRIFYLFFFFFISISLQCQKTEIFYLSGTGNDNTVDWQFYCTAGHNSGNWTTIPVPSNWELQGFGKYDYGLVKDTLRGKEQGFYKHIFFVPDSWKGKYINIVFEGVMTDAEVKINGKLAGPIHHGAFYIFKYNISNLLKYGTNNLIEVIVSKHSSNQSVNKAERFADYWIFGGIYRPVYLEVLPNEHIKNIKIKADADGKFVAKLFINNLKKTQNVFIRIFSVNENKTVLEQIFNLIQQKDNSFLISSKLENPLLWTPETPNLYKIEISLISKNITIHSVTEKFGFRTVELRERDGIYLNGVKIKFKGICRHSFWPSSGRTTSKQISIADAMLIKDMNMNAVRNSHYPADKHFYEICDSLGLLVLDELGGWHNYYDTETGTKLITEMIDANSNHPCIVMWVNGNEGGHNFDLDNIFDSLDIQKRPVIHAWEEFRGTDTQHYINYDYGNGTHFHGHNVFFPTEFLHGLYDGGLGAGLYDYWELMNRSPLSAGGFLWNFSDETVVRTDRNGELDSDGSHAPDGIMGPYREKEASYYTVKEVWSPIYFEPKEITYDFDGIFVIENRYFFTNTNKCSFYYKLYKSKPYYSYFTDSIKGNILSPDIEPGDKGFLKLNLPSNWHDFDVLYISAFDQYNKEIFTWSWPLKIPSKYFTNSDIKAYNDISVIENDSVITFNTGKIEFSISKHSGLLLKVKKNNVIIPFNNGPVLCEGVNDFKSLKYYKNNNSVVVEYAFGGKSNFKDLKWTVLSSGLLKLEIKYFPPDYESDMMGVSFSFPENLVTSIEWMGDGPYRVWKNRMQGNRFGVWKKNYNNTVTGESGFVYPEFKGYHSRFYWAKFNTIILPFAIYTTDEDIFLRNFTPQPPKEAFNCVPPFPTGEISFMQGIPPIGTKSQKPENMGPSGKKNMYFDYWKARPKQMTIYFNFLVE